MAQYSTLMGAPTLGTFHFFPIFYFSWFDFISSFLEFYGSLPDNRYQGDQMGFENYAKNFAQPIIFPTLNISFTVDKCCQRVWHDYIYNF
jgi:hypothetical protein